MPVVILLIAFMTLSTMMVTSLPLKQAKKFERKNGTFDSASNSFSDGRGKTFPFFQTDFNPQSGLIDVETIETALIRTCRAVSTIAHDNDCSEWNKASYIWSFAGTIGGTGSLDSASTDTKKAVFSCTDNAEFARGLYQDSLPASFVVGQGYFYDFTGMNDENSDPCGYANIVRY